MYGGMKISGICPNEKDTGEKISKRNVGELLYCVNGSTKVEEKNREGRYWKYLR